MSEASGNKYRDRYGRMRNQENKKIGVVEIVLRKWRERHGLDYTAGQHKARAG